MSTTNRIMIKEVTLYSEEFKKKVVNEVLSGHICKEEARRRYGIKGNSMILTWIRKFDSNNQMYTMKRKIKAQPEQTILLKAENKRLREELELERLRVLSLNVMIDLAEEEFKVPIRKKSGAKQSKK